MRATRPDPAARRALGQRRDEWRMVLVMIAFVIAYGTLGVRMGAMSLADPVEPQMASADGEARAARAEIVDRNGHLLAGNLPAWSLFARPHEITDPAGTAAALVPIFPDLSEATLRARLSAPRKFVWVKRPVTPRQKQAIMDLVPARPALKFGRRETRIYPAGPAAAHLLGRVGTDAEGVTSATMVGQAGAELHFDARLRDPALADRPLALSIHLGAQQAMHDVLRRGMAHLGAKAAVGVMLDVETGEVIASVSLPDFDPNAPMPSGPIDPEGPRLNRAVAGLFELGSTIKTFTAAIAIEAGLVGPQTLIDVTTPLTVRRQTFRERHKIERHITVADIISRSANLGVIRMALGVGTPAFKDKLRALGFFDPLDLEVGEAPRARPLLPPKWTDLSTATASFGHGFSISPMHLAAAYATLANGGRKVTPSLVRGGRAPGARVFSAETSAQMVEILRHTVEKGTGRRADVPGYEVGGKTGTAEKLTPGGTYDDDRVLSSFAAIFPASRPRYAMVIMLDEPTDPDSGSRQASRTAVPLAREAITRIAPIMGLKPSEDTPLAAHPALTAAYAD